ncbi:peptidylprolyl isomerase [Skermanella pratensis]|uniref:peptidylprolyl isomerase n=1 Tax=Skermanella pratensis TaxID=2233999 RepID=UPI0013013DE4|nr:peptidylprolyl isomerase [Skermanella pratensis]
MELGTAVTTVKGDPITVADVILHLKAKGTFRTAIYEIIERRVVEYKLEEHGVSLTDAEIEERVHGRKTMLALWDENAFASYLKHFGLTREQWLDTLAADMRRERLRDLVVTKDLVQNHYRQNSARFTSVSIARIACRTRADAERALAAVGARQADFVELARLYSVDDNTKLSGGYIGNLKRGMLPTEVDERAFACDENEIIGPFSENGLWTIYKVYSRTVTKLNDALTKQIKDHIFEEWLRHQVCVAPA